METQAQPSTRILVVQPDAVVMEEIKGALLSEGYHVDLARNGRSALQLIKENPYDLIISDLHVPVINGEQLYYESSLTRQGVAERFIFIGNKSASTEFSSFLRVNPVKFLQKPLRTVDVIGEARMLVSRLQSKTQSDHKMVDETKEGSTLPKSPANRPMVHRPNPGW